MDLVTKHNLQHTSCLTDSFWDDLHRLLEAECIEATRRGGTVNDGVRQIKVLWEQLKSLTGNPCFHDKAWGYFYATRVVPLKKQGTRPSPAPECGGIFRKLFGILFLNETWEDVPVQTKERKVHIERNPEPKRQSFSAAQQYCKDLPPEVLSAAEILGVAAGKLTLSYIRKQFLKKAKVTHPDKGGNHVMFEAVNEAKTVLIDWVNRRK